MALQIHIPNPALQFFPPGEAGYFQGLSLPCSAYSFWLRLLCANSAAANQEMFVQIMEIQYKYDRFELRTIPGCILFNIYLSFTHFGLLTCNRQLKISPCSAQWCLPHSCFSCSCWNLFDFSAPQSSGSELAPALIFLWFPLHIWELRQYQDVFFFQFNFTCVPSPVILC